MSDIRRQAQLQLQQLLYISLEHLLACIFDGAGAGHFDSSTQTFLEISLFCPRTSTIGTLRRPTSCMLTLHACISELGPAMQCSQLIPRFVVGVVVFLRHCRRVRPAVTCRHAIDTPSSLQLHCRTLHGRHFHRIAFYSHLK